MAGWVNMGINRARAVRYAGCHAFVALSEPNTPKSRHESMLLPGKSCFLRDSTRHSVADSGGESMARGARLHSAAKDYTSRQRHMRAAKREIRFAICLAGKPDEDLQEGKVYRVLPDPQAAEVGCLRIIDDSGEDYLYAAKHSCW